MTLVSVALGSVVGAALYAGLAGGGNPPPGLDRVTNAGTPIPTLSASDTRVLEKVGRPGAATRLLAASEGRAIYRIGSDCYGVGELPPTDQRFGSVHCGVEFPSSSHPIVDFTVVHGRFDDAGKVAEMNVWRSEGVAADGVAAVAFRTAAGEIVGRAAVTDNVYRHSTIPEGELVAVVALDASGNILASESLR
ncbi:MAG TPA: hypothetical protein VNJ46_02235 [Gaiellaceae bacterium]|nr:hypothetical protein [Gaiellaceae bacterium]